MEVKSTNRLRVLEGNEAVAYGVLLCQPDVIAAYPITPQTSALEHLYHFKSDGLLQSEMVEVEGEHSAMSVVIGAAKAGGRTFTSTSSQGLLFMYEPYIDASTSRLPIVMGIATREVFGPPALACSHQDAMLVRDGGWIQIHVESCQEILDSIIMAYRLAEDPEVLLPVSICYDGFYLSYLSGPVDIPSQEQVSQFLPSRKAKLRLDPDTRLSGFAHAWGVLGVEYRYKHVAAMQRAKRKIDEIDAEFQTIFGRSYQGQIEEYKCGDADIVLLAVGSCAGTAKVVVDEKRDEGQKVGLIKVRAVSPFPKERLVSVLAGKKAIGVIDRNVCFGWGCGALFAGVKATTSDFGTCIPMVNFIDGISGTDITKEHLERAIDTVNLAAQGALPKEVIWLGIE